MEIKLIAGQGSTGLQQRAALEGMRVFGSTKCEEHQIAVLICNPAGQDLDVVCALQGLDDMKRILLNSARTEPSEN